MTRAHWTRAGRYYWQHRGGGKVCATPGKFSAWAAPEAPELSHWQWHAASPDVRARYDGTPVAQRVALLGIRDSLEAACDLVEAQAQAAAA